GIVSMLVLAVAALAVGSVGTRTAKKDTATTAGPTAVNQALSGAGTTLGTLQEGTAEPAPVAGPTVQGQSVDSSGLPATPDRIERTADITLEVKKGSFDAQWTTAFRIAQRFNGQIMSSTRSEEHTSELQ